jgi:protein O-GlcNAc transferase
MRLKPAPPAPPAPTRAAIDSPHAGGVRWRLSPQAATVSPSRAPADTPDSSEHGAYQALLNRAHRHMRAQQFSRAEALLRQAVALAGTDRRAHRHLAVVWIRQSRFVEALELLRELLQAAPGDEILMLNVGVVLFQLNQMDEARSALMALLHLHPRQLMGRVYLANALLRQPQQALEVLRPVMEQASAQPDLSFTLATVYERLQDPPEALRHYEMALAARPNHAESLSNWLLTRHFIYPMDLGGVRDTAVRHGEVLQREAQAGGWLGARPVPRSVGARLRVGIMSSDLRKHVVAYFLESVLQALQTQGVELIAYANHETSEQASPGIKACFARWHDIKALPDPEAARLIAADDLDVLLDLNGHTNGRRLGVLQRKPAVRQVSWLGYFGTTGMPFMDAVIADPHCVPFDEAKYFSERLLYMPNSRLCLSEPVGAPAVAPEPPMASLPWITLGCFQNINKINDRVLALWRRVLEAVPASVLRLQSLRMDKPEQVVRMRDRLGASGIDVKRVWIGPSMPRQTYLAQYAEIDVLLDTFPYPGGTTTAEAIWMGVPTLTLATPGMLGRQGQAMLEMVGLGDWVVHSEDEYVAKAVALARDRAGAIGRLRAIRRDLRETARHSALFDARAFAKDLEKLLRDFCAQSAGRSAFR